MEEYEELYIKDLSKKKGISIEDAIVLLDRCIRSTAENKGLSYADVYKIIHSMEFMSMCLVGRCAEHDLERCKRSCWCVVFEGKCYPRYFEDAMKMNADPDKYLLGMPTDKLASLVKIASYLYYNYDGGGITDNTFDAFEYTLNKRLKLRGRRYEKIGAAPVEKIREKLQYGMPSLNKVKPGSRELTLFMEKATSKNKRLHWSTKLDGVSGMAIYKDGVCSGLYTRGDGSIGGNVTYILPYIAPLPKIKDPRYGRIVLRGEFIIKRKTWEEKYGSTQTQSRGEYTNPRSFVSAKINSGYIPATGILDIELVVYEIIDIDGKGGQIPSPEESMKILGGLGFSVVENGVLEDPVVFDLIMLYREKRLNSLYSIDGLVLSENVQIKVADRAENPKNVVAFKMRLEEQIRNSKVLDVEWNVSRYGRIVPVAIYESVYVDGVRMHRASAFNAGRVKEWSLGRGTRIRVIRSGDVIPTILSVEEDPSIIPIYPSLIAPGALGKDKGWHWEKQDIILNDTDNNRIVQLKRSEHFFVTIGVPRLREKTLEKLWDSGIRTIKGITNATVADFAKIKGIGKKTSVSIHASIHSVMRKTRLDRFIPASTTLKLGIGRKVIKQLLNYHPTLMEDSSEVLSIILPKKNIPGIGAKRVKNIVENIEKFKSFLFALNKEDIEFAIKHDLERIKSIASRGYNPKIRGKTFVFTGFFGKVDYELEDYIYDNYGMFSPLATASVEVVISANLMDVTSKMLEAERLHIKVLSIEEFIKTYDIPISSKKNPGDAGDEEDVVLLERAEEDE